MINGPSLPPGFSFRFVVTQLPQVSTTAIGEGCVVIFS